MKFKVGDHVKLTNQFGIWDGVPAYPDVDEQGKTAEIIAVNPDGYELMIDEHEGGIYGAIPENAVEFHLHPL